MRTVVRRHVVISSVVQVVVQVAIAHEERNQRLEAFALLLLLWRRPPLVRLQRESQAVRQIPAALLTLQEHEAPQTRCLHPAAALRERASLWAKHDHEPADSATHKRGHATT